jgi:predicted permease
VALFCGLIPAIRTGRSGALDASRGAGRVQVSTRNSVQWLLVGAQIALSVTLLTGAGLLVRSFYELSRVDPGFEPARVLTFRMSASWAETADYGRLTQRIDDTLGALHALPGVEAAATSTFLPGVPAQYELTFGLVEARDNAAIRMVAERRAVSPEYFETMRIPVLEGRVCGRPTPGGAADVMVNRAFAARYLTPYATPVGLHLVQDGSPSDVSRIVGVVGDARERGLDLEPAPVAYACLSAPNPRPYFLVRASGDPAAIAQSVRIRLDELEPLRAVYDVATIEDQLGGTFAEDRLRMVLLSLFAATALTLATVGLYGTLSYAVSLRRREIGLRLALGALRRDIVGQFLGRGLRVAGIACVCGVLASIATTRLLATMLYGVSPSDPLTLAAVIAIVLVVAALAAFIPAARAALIEPVRALRQE